MATQAQAHLLRGVTVPLATPMRQDGTPDLAALPRVIDYILAGGVNSLFLLGGNGEHVAVYTEEIEQIVDTAHRHLAAQGKRAEVPILCGTGGASTREALRRGEAALRGGADALVVLPPFYFIHRPEELVDHYRMIARLGAPMVAYNIPRYTNNPLTLEVVRELLNIPQFIGIKDSSSDDEYFTSLLQLVKEREDVGVSQGAERRLLWALQMGATGITPGLANIAPRLCAEIYREPAGKAAERYQRLLDDLAAIQRIRSGIAGTKGALHLLGVCQPYPAPPFRPLTEEELQEVARLLTAAGLWAEPR
jgi:4-hydroxy-tetrahydrodipicolinate synthase